MTFRFRDNPVYWIGHRLAWLFGRLWLGLTAEGLEHVPATGGCLLAANHASYLDPPLLGAPIFSRRVRFMARDTLAKHPFVRWFTRKVDCIMIDRTRGDLGALKAAVKALKEGACVAIFPEGTRTLDGRIQEAKGGIGLLIAKAGVPVVPVCLDGTFEAYPKGARRLRRHPVTIRYGRPIPPEAFTALGDGRDRYDRIGALVMARIAELHPNRASAARKS